MPVRGSLASLAMATTGCPVGQIKDANGECQWVYVPEQQAPPIDDLPPILDDNYPVMNNYPPLQDDSQAGLIDNFILYEPSEPIETGVEMDYETSPPLPSPPMLHPDDPLGDGNMWRNPFAFPVNDIDPQLDYDYGNMQLNGDIPYDGYADISDLAKNDNPLDRQYSKEGFDMQTAEGYEAYLDSLGFK